MSVGRAPHLGPPLLAMTGRETCLPLHLHHSQHFTLFPNMVKTIPFLVNGSGRSAFNFAPVRKKCNY